MKLKNPWRVLVFPAGTENGMEIRRALLPCKEVLLFAAAAETPNHAPYLYEKVQVIPDVRKDDAAWLTVLNTLIKKEKLDFVFPANDFVIDALNRRRDDIDCLLLLPPSKAVEIARSKKRAKECLRGLLPVARAAGEDGVPMFPIVVKPDDGYGGMDVSIAHNEEELQRMLGGGMFAEEHLPGKEYSVDCFTDRHGRLRFCGGRERVRVRMGTSMSGRLAPSSVQAMFDEWARQISAALGMRGAWFFQAKEDAAGELRFTEVDVRIAGTMSLNRVRGINFPLLSLYDAADMDIEIPEPLGSVEIERALCSRYSHSIAYNTVYVDWDDTVILRGQLNLEVVRFLFQCVGRGAKIVLLTQSLSENLAADIATFRLTELFDEVIHLPLHIGKETRINPRGAIFIDDSFSHRQAVAKMGVPSFSPDMVEMLQDERI